MRLSTTLIIAMASMLGASGAAAQTDRSMAVEMRPAIGIFIPTGAQSADFTSSALVGFQGALEMSNSVHGVLSGGWTHSHTKYASTTGNAAYIWQFDAGLEINRSRAIERGWSSRPFVGVGAGIRAYDYAGIKVGSDACAAAYGSLGYELQRGDLALRAESRDYLSCFTSPVTGRNSTRNDVGISFGIAYHMF